MRLITSEINFIKKAFNEIFGYGKIYLFGSRTNDNERGGDIDLYLMLNEKIDDKRGRKIEFLIKLDEYLGEQKIDVIIAKNPNRLIEQEALNNGILL